MAIPNVVGVSILEAEGIYLDIDLPEGGTRYVFCLSYGYNGDQPASIAVPEEWDVIYSGAPVDDEQGFFQYAILISTTSDPAINFSGWRGTNPGVETSLRWAGTIWAIDSEIDKYWHVSEFDNLRGEKFGVWYTPTVTTDAPALVFHFKNYQSDTDVYDLENVFPSQIEETSEWANATVSSQHQSHRAGWLQQQSAGTTAELIWPAGTDETRLWGFSIDVLALAGPDSGGGESKQTSVTIPLSLDTFTSSKKLARSAASFNVELQTGDSTSKQAATAVDLLKLFQITGDQSKDVLTTSRVSTDLTITQDASKQAETSAELNTELTLNTNAAKLIQDLIRLSIESSIGVDSTKHGYDTIRLSALMSLLTDAEKYIQTMTTLTSVLGLTSDATKHARATTSLDVLLGVEASVVKEAFTQAGIDLELSLKGFFEERLPEFHETVASLGLLLASTALSNKRADSDARLTLVLSVSGEGVTKDVATSVPMTLVLDAIAGLSKTVGVEAALGLALDIAASLYNPAILPPAERTMQITVEDRTLRIRYEDRTITIPFEERTNTIGRT